MTADKIKAEIQKRFSREGELDLALLGAQQELTAAESAAAAAVADGADADESSGLVSKVANKERTLRAAITEVRRQRAELIVKLRQVEAADFRERAAALRTEADAAIRKATPTLEVLCSQLGITASIDDITNRFGGAASKLRSEALDLESRAKRIESAKTKTDGTVEITTSDPAELIARTRTRPGSSESREDPLTIGPPAHEIRAFVEVYERAIQQRPGLRNLARLPRAYRVAWNEAGIDSFHSQVLLGENLVDPRLAGAPVNFTVAQREAGKVSVA